MLSIFDKPSLHRSKSKLLYLLTCTISGQDAVALWVSWNTKEIMFTIRIAITIVSFIHHLAVLDCQRVAPESGATVTKGERDSSVRVGGKPDHLVVHAENEAFFVFGEGT